MVKQTLSLLLLLYLSATTQLLDAQCNPSSPEIPGNGFDEDCDGLDDFYFVLPPAIYAVEGQDLEIYFRNLLLTKHPQDYAFSVSTPLAGQSDGKKWSFTPSTNSAGEYPISISVKTPGGQTLQTASTTVRIAPDDAPADMNPKKLWLFGHSFFDQGYLPKYLWDKLFFTPNNPQVNFYGKKVSWANGAARHEGYGGMMARWFFNDPGSPVRYGNKINMRQYFNEVVGQNQRPDWIVFHLDINDFCGYSALAGNSLQEIDDTIIGDWNRHATRLIDSIRLHAPNAKLAICISPPPNARESSFAQTYGGNQILNNRWRWQKIINRLIFKNIERYGNRENQGIYLIPEYLDIDDFSEYNPPDARHPDPPDNNINTHCGYMEIAKTIYAWFRWIQHHPNPGGQTFTFYRDADGDNFGKTSDALTSASAPVGYVPVPGDCDDSNPAINPAATENCKNGLDDNCNAQIDEDGQAPTALCKNALTLPLNASGEANLLPQQIDNGSEDNCSATLNFSLSKSHFTCPDAGSTPFVILQVSDAAGNVSTCQAPVFVVDQLPPNALCISELQVKLNATGDAVLDASQINEGSSDNCGSLNFSIDKTVFNCSHIGQQNVTMTVKDAAGNASTCQSKVWVKDEIAPTAICRNSITLSLDIASTAQLTENQVDNGSFDACGINLSLSQTHFDCSDVGQHIVVLTATDLADNFSDCQITVIVEDLSTPDVLCKGSQILPLDANGQAQITENQADNGSWDACPFTLALDKKQFDCSEKGEHLLTLKATDQGGNTATCQLTVWVTDQLPPMLGIPVSPEVELAFNNTGLAMLNLSSLVSATENCNDVIWSYSFDNQSFTDGGNVEFSCQNFPVGQKTPLWVRARDLSGNLSLPRKFDIIGKDLGTPTVTCKNLEISPDAFGLAVVDLNLLQPTATDICGTATILPFESQVLTCNEVGKIQIMTIQATDNAGNIGLCNALVTIADAADADGDGTPNCADQCPQNSATASLLTFYVDFDKDGFGAGAAILSCLPPPGTSTNNSDCDDLNPSINISAPEILNNLDDDCDGQIDEGLVSTNEAGDSKLQISPNPTSGKFSVSWQTNQAPEKILLTDPTGRVFESFSTSSFSFGKLNIDAEALPSGVYFLKIKFAENRWAAGSFQKI